PPQGDTGGPDPLHLLVQHRRPADLPSTSWSTSHVRAHNHSGSSALRTRAWWHRSAITGTVISYCPSCNRVLGSFHWCGVVLVERLGVMVPGGTDSLWCGQVRVRGLVRRAAGLRCPDSLMRWRHWVSMWLVQGMQSRLPAPRRAVSLPVLI